MLALQIAAVVFCYWAAYQAASVRLVLGERIFQSVFLGTITAAAVLVFLSFIQFP